MSANAAGPGSSKPRRTQLIPLRREIRALLERLVEPAYAAKIKELVPAGMTILGVRVPAIRAAARAFLGEHPEIDAELACDLYEHCCDRPCREELLFAQGLLERRRRKLDPAIWPRLERWIDAIDNWEICDQLSKNVAAELIARQPALARRLIAMTRSENPWRRRFALATSTALNQGGRSDVDLALEVCAPLMCEDVPIVRKAVGWALREAAKNDHARVGQFLRQHEAHASPQILKEARGGG